MILIFEFKNKEKDTRMSVFSVCRDSVFLHFVQCIACCFQASQGKTDCNAYAAGGEWENAVFRKESHRESA